MQGRAAIPALEGVDLAAGTSSPFPSVLLRAMPQAGGAAVVAASSMVRRAKERSGARSMDSLPDRL